MSLELEGPLSKAFALPETWVQLLPPTRLTAIQSQGTLFSQLRALSMPPPPAPPPEESLTVRQ